MDKFKLAIAIPLLFVLTACATIFSGSTQPLNVRATDPNDGSTPSTVTCTVIDNNGYPLSVDTNPGVVTVSRGTSALQVSCSDADNLYKDTAQGIGARVNPVTFVNILFWPGFFVDLATGAIMKYPASVTIPMSQEV